jgi:hypothetical protein
LALEIAAHFVETDYVFVMHNDVLVLPGWLEFLCSKLNERVRGVAVSCDPARMHAMHQSGFLFDFTLFHSLRMSFLPKVPDYDAGDLVTLRLREAGYKCVICRNTFNDPEAVESIPAPVLKAMYCDRIFDDEGRVIYLHLGRGTPKSTGTYQQPGKTGVEQWLRYARDYVLTGQGAAARQAAPGGEPAAGAGALLR